MGEETPHAFGESKENPFTAKFEEFFKTKYKKHVERLVGEYPDKRSLLVDYKDLNDFDPFLANEVLDNPDYVLEAMHTAVQQVDVPALGIDTFTPTLRVHNLPMDKKPLIKHIGAQHLGKLIAVEGVVKQITEVLPKLKMATWKCRRCGNTYAIEQEKQKNKMPSMCECKHRDFELDEQHSTFTNYQKVAIQEPLEQLKGSELANSLDVYVEDDFVNKVSPGDTTIIVGVLRLYPSKEHKNVFGRYLEAVHVEETQQEFEDVDVNEEEEADIRTLAKDPKIYETLIQSIAPNIYGHSMVKEAIALQLFGGVKKALPSQNAIRGNIHVLLVGDPGLAKCVSGDALVPLGDGTLTPIAQLAENLLNQNAQVLVNGTCALVQQTINIPLLDSHTRQSIGRVVAVSKRKADKMFEVTTQTGKTLRCTHTHPLFVSKNAKVVATPTQELKEGDFIAVPRTLKVQGKDQRLEPARKGKTHAVHIQFPETTNPELGAFIGLLLSEGYSRNVPGSTYCMFTNSDAENLDLFEKLSLNLFGLCSHKYSRRQAKNYRLQSTELYDFLSKNTPELMKGSRHRTIPLAIQKSGDETVKAFLQTFIECEGHVRGNIQKKKHERVIEVSSASKRLIEELSHLLLRFGIVSITKPVFNMATNGSRIKRPYWKLSMHGPFAQLYCEKMGFITQRKKEKAQKLMFNVKTNPNLDVIPHIANELKRIRHVLGLTQSQCGVPRTAFEHYEHGDRNPSRGQLYQIANSFFDSCAAKGVSDFQAEHDIINLMKLALSDIFWDKITRIKEVECEDVYDFEVEGMHNFISNGIYSHNSQLLQATDRIAPKSIYVAGKTSSGVGLCVAPDSLILNENGFKPIEEFVETTFKEKSACEELPGAFSNPFSGNTPTLTEQLDFSIRSVEKIWRIQAPEKMVRIATRTGRELALTPATSLIRIKQDKLVWVPANELMEGDYVAVPRFLPEGKRKNIPTFTLLIEDSLIKIGNPLAQWIKEVIERLVPKYGSKQAIASALGKSRGTLYAIQNPKFYHGWELQKVVSLAREAGCSDEEISQKISILFIRHGKTIQIPQYADNQDIAYLAGAILGDGCMEEERKRTTIRVCGNDPYILNRCEAILQKHFGINPEHEKNTERVPSIRVSSQILGKILYAYGMRHKKNEIVLSHMVTEMPNNVLRCVLQGLFDTDGYVTNPKKKGSSHVGLSTISPKLAQTIQLALLKFGIVSKKRMRKKAGKTGIGKKIRVTSRHDAYCIEIYGKENLVKFKEKIGFALERKQNALTLAIQKIQKINSNIDVVPEIYSELGKIKAGWLYTKKKRNISYRKLKEITKETDEGLLKKLGMANVFWDQIKHKEEFTPSYPYVYDLTVAESHNFIANGFYVHNTASAVKDEFGEGGWTLKAGALVLASGGITCVDEFDKMEPEDRSAMHEAMEQGMVSVAKAGIVTRFKTDTSVLAAANPKFSRFDPFMNFMEQIDLPATLISRFDLFFMIRDVLDRTKDENISAHILKTHQYGEVLLQEKRSGRKVKDFQREGIEKTVVPAIKRELLAKYISFARQNVFPVLSHEAFEAIQEYYLDLRDQGRKSGTYAATHRQLEGLVRLSEASARVRLSDEVAKEDAERAIRLVKSSLEDVVTDPETGKIDIDIISTGQSHSQVTNLKKILSVLKSKGKENEGGMVAKMDIVEELKADGVDADKVEDLISKLKKKGEIYEPRHGFLKATETH